MEVEPPDEIDPSAGAKIKNAGNTTLVVTITSDGGAVVTVEVPPNSNLLWYPPAGWRTARFNAPNQRELFRTIAQEASA